MRLFWLVTLTLSLGLSAYAATITQEVEIPRTTLKDVYKYYVLEETKKNTTFIVTYKRLSSNTILYGKAEINCPSKVIRSLGQNVNSAKSIDVSNPTAWQKPTLGTIEFDMVTYVCR